MQSDSNGGTLHASARSTDVNDLSAVGICVSVCVCVCAYLCVFD